MYTVAVVGKFTLRALSWCWHFVRLFYKLWSSKHSFLLSQLFCVAERDRMDALGDYGSDSDASSSSSGKDKANQAATTATPTAVVPAYNGPSGWVHGHAHHLLTKKKLSLQSPLVMITSLSSLKNHAKEEASSSTTKTPLAQTLRAQHEFGNPKQLETTMETLGIAEPFGSNLFVNNSVPQFADWEHVDNLLVLEEQARQQAAASNITGVLPASDFVQNQMSRAMTLGGTR